MSDHRLNIPQLGSSKSLKMRAYDALRSAVMCMDIYAADAELLLDERDLSARLGISRTPIREALILLEREGIVRVVPRRGIFIVRKSERELHDMITVWAAVEGMAARVAASDASDEAFDDLGALLEGDDEASAATYSEANIAFHRAIIAAAQNTVATQVTSQLLFHVRALRQHIDWNEERRARSVTDHRRIVSALQMRDADECERLVREHTLRMRDQIDETASIN